MQVIVLLWLAKESMGLCVLVLVTPDSEPLSRRGKREVPTAIVLEQGGEIICLKT